MKKIIQTLLVIFLLILNLINAFVHHNLSSKVMIWNHHIKIYKCPIHASEEEIKNDFDPSILIFKKSHFIHETLKQTPVIISNQTDYLAHQVKGLATFNEFSFAYASLASLHDLFDRVHIINQPGYFQLKNSNPNIEYVPEDELMSKLNIKTNSKDNNVFQLTDLPVYKCKGKNGSIYLLTKSTSNITINLKVNDVIYSEKSNGFLETIRNIDKIDISSDEHRLIIETKLTDCSINQDKLESKLKNFRLINLEKNDLNCQGGYNSNLSLYLTKNTTYISKLIRKNSLINSVIVGRKSNKFAYRIVSIKAIGNQFLLFETSELLFPMNKIRSKRWSFGGFIKSVVKAVNKVVNVVVNVVKKVVNFVTGYSTMYDWNYTKRFTYQKTKSFDLIPVGRVSISFSFSPAVTVTASLRASISGVQVLKAGLIVDINANLNAKLNLNTITIDYDWPEKDLIPLQQIARFVVPAGPIIIPGTLNVGLFSTVYI